MPSTGTRCQSSYEAGVMGVTVTTATKMSGGRAKALGRRVIISVHGQGGTEIIEKVLGTAAEIS